MENKTIYPKGLRVFKPHEKAPEFVKCTLLVTPNELIKFCKENLNLMTEYKGNKQLKCQILDGKNGLYVSVDTYKPDKKKDDEPTDFNDVKEDLPF